MVDLINPDKRKDIDAEEAKAYSSSSRPNYSQRNSAESTSKINLDGI